MSIRTKLYISLIKELLGPRYGATELIQQDPRDEYVTGILEPKDYDRSTLENYTTADIRIYKPEALNNEEPAENLTDDADDFDITPNSFLDPRALPKSMGISFVIGSAKPTLHICITWARYYKEGNDWKRKPHKFVVMNCNASLNSSWEPVSGVKIVLWSTKLKDELRHISIYLINTTNIEKKDKKGEKRIPSTPDMVFQPEIRIVLSPNVVLESIDDKGTEGDEERKLELLYREFPALARGHLCGAVWKEIDPARPMIEGEQTSVLLSEDIKLLTPEERRLFELPDIRTDYLPAYSIKQSIVGRKEMGLDTDDVIADSLSNKFDPNILFQSLSTLHSSYGRWIEHQRKKIDEIPATHRQVAVNNITQCEESFKRIGAGIKILQEDENSRLAFCFMNAVMDTQSLWIRKIHLEWRPFQLAFILQCIQGIVNEIHPDRNICDLLWFPTGGGKTEAYLGLMLFTIAYRRRKSVKDLPSLKGAGTSVISRYTLRLLTIQQFRRALNAITACDYLRICNWKPKDYKSEETNLWGTVPFSIGLWVGDNVTPNNMIDRQGFDKSRKIRTRYVGAVGVLTNHHKDGDPGTEWSGGEPAQVLKCPCCSSILAVPSAGLPGQEFTIHWIFKSNRKPSITLDDLNYGTFRVLDVKIRTMPNPSFYVLSIRFTNSSPELKDDHINQWWTKKVSEVIAAKKPECAYASRPGYFIRRVNDKLRSACDFEIHCPNPDCQLNQVEWFEKIPSSKDIMRRVIEPFDIPSKEGMCYGVPIPAYTVDAQIYAKCPSIIISTVDKFARLPFETGTASIFGNVNRFDNEWGYYRVGNEPYIGSAPPLKPISVEKFLPPDLIVQDELHLIEGPLGSLFGLYETALDILTSYNKHDRQIKAKYIASTATVRQASSQVLSLYARPIAQFPPSGLVISNNFFSQGTDGHPLDSNGPGRLYVGVCAPGKGPQTPTIRIWARLLQEVENIRKSTTDSILDELDYYWTLVGYFNAIRELAQADSLYRQDIPERIKNLSENITDPVNTRRTELTSYLELSSRIDSLKLPAIMEQLERPGDDIDAVFATSMFGTGVDVNRLSLMVVHGQPKSTASYIQATGRVGREKGAIIVTFLRSTRPRDLAHYEFFTGYHRALHRYVEPVTVAPFSPRACDRALGPVAVAILRNASTVENVSVNPEWSIETFERTGNGKSGARLMSSNRNAMELDAISERLEKRAQVQPEGRKRPEKWVKKHLESGFDLWRNIVLENTSTSQHKKMEMYYHEPTYNYEPEHPVVLGDASHKKHKQRQVFENVPQSLRDIESTTRFEG